MFVGAAGDVGLSLGILAVLHRVPQIGVYLDLIGQLDPKTVPLGLAPDGVRPFRLYGGGGGRGGVDLPDAGSIRKLAFLICTGAALLPRTHST